MLAPDHRGWPEPGAAVLTWVGVHVSVSLLLVVAALAWWLRSGSGSLALVLVWLAAGSGLVVRLGAHLVGSAPLPAPRTRWWPGALVQLGLAVAVAVTLGRAEPAMAAVWAAAALLLAGVRWAGLMAWSGELPLVRRRLVRWPTLLPMLAAVVMTVDLAAVVVLTVTGQVNDPVMVGGALGVGLALGAVGVILVAGAMSALGAYVHERDSRLLAAARRSQRLELAALLHDEALVLAREVRRRSEDPEHRRLAIRLERLLRTVQLELGTPAGPRTVRSGLERGVDLANELGLALTIEADRAGLDRRLEAEVVAVVESFVLNHVGNTVDHGGSAARLAVRLVGDEVVLDYSDDAGGFDPVAALDRGRGLEAVRRRVEELGGVLDLRASADRVVARAVVPARPR